MSRFADHPTATTDSTFEPFIERTDVKEHKKVLDTAEKPLRSDSVKTVMTMPSSNERESRWSAPYRRLFPRESWVRTFKEQGPEVLSALDSLRIIFDEAINRCSDPAYFESLLKLVSQQEEKFKLAVEPYGNRQDRNRLDGQAEWDNCVEYFKSINIQNPLGRTQPFKGDILEFYLHAVVTQNNLRRFMENFVANFVAEEAPAGQGDGEFEGPKSSGVKSLYRTWLKIALDKSRRENPDNWGHDAVWDVCRALVSFNCIEDIKKAFEKLKRCPELEIVNFSNRFRKERKNEWQDVKIHVLFKAPDIPAVICEIQFCLQEMSVCREDLRGHDDYSVFRSLDELRRFVDPDGSKERALGPHEEFTFDWRKATKIAPFDPNGCPLSPSVHPPNLVISGDGKTVQNHSTWDHDGNAITQNIMTFLGHCPIPSEPETFVTISVRLVAGSHCMIGVADNWWDKWKKKGQEFGEPVDRSVSCPQYSWSGDSDQIYLLAYRGWNGMIQKNTNTEFVRSQRAINGDLVTMKCGGGAVEWSLNGTKLEQIELGLSRFYFPYFTLAGGGKLKIESVEYEQSPHA